MMRSREWLVQTASLIGELKIGWAWRIKKAHITWASVLFLLLSHLDACRQGRQVNCLRLLLLFYQLPGRIPPPPLSQNVPFPQVG